MHITISASGKNVEKLSYVFGKNPENDYKKETKHGLVEFKYLHYSDEFVKCCIMFTPNGLQLVRESEFAGLEDYINDREFSLSTIFLTNIRKSIGYVFNREYEGVNNIFEFEIELGPISTKLPNDIILQLFEPLGYEVKIKEIIVDYNFDVNSSKVIELILKSKTNIISIFQHIYVLIPILDNYKHHEINDDEIDKLFRLGEDWIYEHPKVEFIIKRYLRYSKKLSSKALDIVKNKTIEEQDDSFNSEVKKERLGDLRYSTFVDKIKQLGINEVVDMGSGDGKLVELLLYNSNISKIIACEPTLKGISIMKERSYRWKKNSNIEFEIIQGSLFFKDDRIKNKECITLCEVIEHIDKDRIDDVMNIILGYNTPKYFIISTPNVEYNVLYGINRFRHNDHRFEMTRKEFCDFIEEHCIKHNYILVEMIGIGQFSEEYGHPTQMAILMRKD